MKITPRVVNDYAYGNCLYYSRTINGTPYRFTFVIMPDGERRHFVDYAYGNCLYYSRTINGTPYRFTFVIMPDGERRHFVRRYNGYGDDGTQEGREFGMRFPCAWTEVHAIIVPSEKAKGASQRDVDKVGAV